MLFLKGCEKQLSCKIDHLRGISQYPLCEKYKEQFTFVVVKFMMVL